MGGGRLSSPESGALEFATLTDQDLLRCSRGPHRSCIFTLSVALAAHARTAGAANMGMCCRSFARPVGAHACVACAPWDGGDEPWCAFDFSMYSSACIITIDEQTRPPRASKS